MAQSQAEFREHIKVAMVDNSPYSSITGGDMPEDMEGYMVDSMARLSDPIWDMVAGWALGLEGDEFPDEKVKMVGGDPSTGYLADKIDNDTIKYNESTFRLYVNSLPTASDTQTGGVRIGDQPYLYMQGYNLMLNAETDQTLVGGHDMVPTSRAVKLYVDAAIIGGGGGGDMLKSTYDTADNGVVDDSERLGNQLPAYYLDWANFTGTGGVVDVTGTPVVNQVAVFTDANTIEGNANFTFTGARLNITGTSSQIMITDSDDGQAWYMNANVGSFSIVDVGGIAALSINTNNTIASMLDLNNDLVQVRTTLETDNIREWTTDAGVTIESILLKDGGMTLLTGATVDTIETTLTDDDTHIPTSGAVYAAVSAEDLWNRTGTTLSTATANDDVQFGSFVNFPNNVDIRDSGTKIFYYDFPTDNLRIGQDASSDTLAGARNIIIGKEAGLDVVSSYNSLIVGYRAGYDIISVLDVILIGSQAGYAATDMRDGTISIGGYSLSSDTNPLGNTVVGYYSLNTATTVNYNVAIGEDTGRYGTSHLNGIYIGFGAGKGHDTNALTFSSNVLIGYEAGGESVTGTYNVGIGHSALRYFEGIGNIGIGYQSLLSGTENYNTAIGYSAGRNAGVSSENVYIGRSAGYGNGVTASTTHNVFMGVNSGYNITSGYQNIAIGTSALYNVATGFENTAIGYHAGLNIYGTQNTFIGYTAGAGATSNASGSGNTFIGYDVGGTYTTGSFNILIGSNLNLDDPTDLWKIKIGVGAVAILEGDMTVASEWVGSEYESRFDNIFEFTTDTGVTIEGVRHQDWRTIYGEITEPSSVAANEGEMYAEAGTFGAETNSVLKYKDENGNVFRVSHKRFVHSQGTAVQVWTIDHNLGQEPNIDVYDNASPPNKVLAPVQHVTVNQSTISMPTGRTLSGKAICEI